MIAAMEDSINDRDFGSSVAASKVATENLLLKIQEEAAEKEETKQE